MTVRKANFVDIPAIVALGADAHENSIYGPISVYDKEAAKQLCARSMQRHGHLNYGGSLVLVSDVDGEIKGFIIAILDQVYPCVNSLSVTDLIFTGGEDMPPRDAIAIIDQVIAWGEDNPNVVEVHLGVTDAIKGQDWRRVGKLYERKGLEQCGGMFRRIIDRNQQEVANV